MDYYKKYLKYKNKYLRLKGGTETIKIEHSETFKDFLKNMSKLKILKSQESYLLNNKKKLEEELNIYESKMNDMKKKYKDDKTIIENLNSTYTDKKGRIMNIKEKIVENKKNITELEKNILIQKNQIEKEIVTLGNKKNDFKKKKQIYNDQSSKLEKYRHTIKPEEYRKQRKELDNNQKSVIININILENYLNKLNEVIKDS